MKIRNFRRNMVGMGHDKSHALLRRETLRELREGGDDPVAKACASLALKKLNGMALLSDLFHSGMVNRKSKGRIVRIPLVASKP